MIKATTFDAFDQDSTTKGFYYMICMINTFLVYIWHIAAFWD